MIERIKCFSWPFVLIFVVISVLPFAASAQSLVLKAPKTTYNVGDSFQVTLSVNTEGKSINTLSGKIQFPTSKFQILDTRYGNSIISLWVERPTVSGGTISFTGGIPGGFSGSAGPILSFGVKARAEGSASISLSDIKILLNDGLGTEAQASAAPFKLTIKKAPPVPKATEDAAPAPKEVYVPPSDTSPPESFIPMISRHPTVADNKYFVSFFAVDKDTGIGKYQIREEPLIVSLITTKFNTELRDAESPYILKGQYWTYEVVVRACDQAGNCTEGFAVKPLSPAIEAAFILALVLISIFITRWIYKPRHPQHRMV
ncbi:hypothetical protein A2926_04305 [Candidatus Giovannonibacteria bacterium RIFCSPLOWO2_01_FULL_44_40]|uniref:Cohesin domain-containing protein n=1 Tax=Candidatus Giovannonibacteria bacterium RIFCSPHIGHO2_01_FULL_45_23 TaxID=1798325 RepID=A0A1F5VFQ0_9BACT|nr:MAG: hypothetical protein A2834_02790 [Candidatus Giovannonibacteria bacterium RIFCSPHIGHO2_01_FULL_45_23]OGF75672.1 MAG: hypothetical protein A3C77_00085 [Candidatus Giovannonibacteria bacterium RIFCSPHIGHO2_02_FULL_45_13]OGF79912.1 MAG: hypothetical protein A2926_04305 [Candidatus Giovannonibacteria bacterium RIFCSPLOWO2_01_FULL_44_40]